MHLFTVYTRLSVERTKTMQSGGDYGRVQLVAG